MDPYRLYQLADSCRERGHLHLWKRAVTLAFQLPHRTQRQVFYRGQAKLALGDWSGWLDREARLFDPDAQWWRCAYWREIYSTTKAWDGREDIRAKTLFVIADGDDGDCLQMLRFVPQLATQAGALILGVSPALHSLVEHNLGSVAVVTFREIDHDIRFERYTWGLSLPACYAALPPFAPLLAPLPRATDERAADQRLHVGVCWTTHGPDPHDISAAMTALLARDGIRWHNVRLGGDTMAERQLRTYADAANVIAGLDCVISVDSPIAHLAALLEVPTLVVLRCAADPKWGSNGATPWYPSMQLIRQTKPGEWAGVANALSVALDVAAQRKCVLTHP
jgi:hypothetical protein